MHDLPVIAIVGRPNVGKSSFFNAVLGRRIAIVDPTAGVTRDRVSAETMYSGRSFELIDTGGIGLFDETALKEEVERQIAIAIDLADAVIFILDIRDGRTPLDEEVAARLRKCGKPVVAVANKADTTYLENYRHDFHSLGFGDPMPASASEKKGIYAVLDEVFELLPKVADDADPSEEESAGRIRVAIVGRTNAGKSTLVNHLVDEERVIVSEVPGTTRDSVDVSFGIVDREFTVIDTAGIRRKRAIQDSVEFYGQARAERAVRSADIVLLLVDATCEISIVDKKIADLVVTSYKPCVVVVSKWDLVDDSSTSEYGDYVADRLRGLHFAPITFISSKTGFNIESTFKVVGELYDQARHRVKTAQINTVLEAAIARRAPQLRKSRLAKIYFGMQVEVGPPTILVFVNDIKLFNHEYRRYLSNQFRKAFPFKEVPIKIAFRGKDRVGAEHRIRKSER
jgi:GTPase